ncbi:NAD(P)-dependent oxidoreductase [Amnibacterium endophyticum]|uniref:NAD(P)-dependent oxidoreductase n=1 Tax=Amnibacterium endophyticum TaxID=2109337 RepID=A0ABW4LA37_9MICO
MTDDTGSIRRILVLGANGPSGRRVVQRALDRGLGVVALTRHPEAFPIRHDRLEVVGGDATDPATMDAAVSKADAVVSTIGVAYTWSPVDVYSAAARHALATMRRHGLRRIVVVTSMGAPKKVEEGGRFRRVMGQVFRSTFTRTLYDDMLRMEDMVSTSGLDWTIVRPPGLADEDGRGYAIQESFLDSPAMARGDLAACLLDLLDREDWYERTAYVATPGMRLELIPTIRKEMLKR